MNIIALLKESFNKWWASNPATMGAALAYYMLFSLIPLMIIFIAVASLFLNSRIIEAKLVNELSLIIGNSGAQFIGSIISQSSNPTASFASVFSVIILIIGALGVFSQLKDSLDIIWKSSIVETGFIAIVRSRIVAFAMIGLVGLLFIASLIVSTVWSLISVYISTHTHATLIILLNFSSISSFIFVITLFILIYKYMPSAVTTWRAVIIGGLVTGLLFMFGRLLIGLYLSIASINSSYGAGSALVAMLIWVFYSAQIFFLGAAFTATLEHALKEKIAEKTAEHDTV